MHTIGYCESEHLWSWLRDPKFDFFSSDRVPESALWGHPKYISQVYRDSPRNLNEILLLANSIAHYRKTNLIPLIKDQFNLFRIGLIKKCFPKARFVFVIRDYEDYFISCKHKWFSSEGIYKHRSIAAHWLNANLIAYGDLREYAPNDYVIINYNQLIDNRKKSKHELDKLCKKLKLNDYKFDLEIINSDYRYSEDNKFNSKWDFNSLPVNDIIEKYRNIIEESINESNL